MTAGQHQITWAPILWAQRDLKLAMDDGLIATGPIYLAMHRFALTFSFIGKLGNAGPLAP